MIGQTARRIVVFYVASCHDDLCWYLSIHSPHALKNSANDPGNNVYNLPGAIQREHRMGLVTPVAE
jgi:hypothetical protein